MMKSDETLKPDQLELVNSLRTSIMNIAGNEELSEQAVPGIQKILQQDQEGVCYRVFYSDEEEWVNLYQNPKGNSCLLLAIAIRSYNVADLLIYDAKSKLTNDEFLSFLNYQCGDNAFPCYTNTALTLAAKHGQYWLAQNLLQQGANPNGEGENGETALSICYFHSRLISPERTTKLGDLLKLLYTKGANANHVDKLHLKPYDYKIIKLNYEKNQFYIVPKNDKYFSLITDPYGEYKLGYMPLGYITRGQIMKNKYMSKSKKELALATWKKTINWNDITIEGKFLSMFGFGDKEVLNHMLSDKYIEKVEDKITLLQTHLDTQPENISNSIYESFSEALYSRGALGSLVSELMGASSSFAATEG